MSKQKFWQIQNVAKINQKTDQSGLELIKMDKIVSEVSEYSKVE